MGKYTVILTPEAKDELRVLHKIGIEATIRKIEKIGSLNNLVELRDKAVDCSI